MNQKTKKMLIMVGGILAVLASVAAMSAYEAHVINVTAHIENALSVSPKEIAFGTVFPQEYIEEEFTVNLSSSFLTEDRVDDVEYVIKQKPKPYWPQTEDCKESHLGIDFEDIDEARAYCHMYPDNLDCCYLSLCPFLSKLPKEKEVEDIGVPSYYQGTICITPDPAHATGRLAKSDLDISDTWIVDLKVPPVAGYVGQDWPAGCPVVDANDQDYGCDLWIEVTGISEGEHNSECSPGAVWACDTGLPGVCTIGTKTCDSLGYWGECVGPEPTAEVCDDGLDNNCDGNVDEGCGPIVGCSPGSERACDTGLLGVCTAGTQTCTELAVWGSCVQDEQSSSETCDGLDNDCDGDVDESLIQGCYSGNPATRGVGVCQDGVQTCSVGQWGSCSGEITPITEVCDNQLDDDCDGETDEGCATGNWTYEQNFNDLLGPNTDSATFVGASSQGKNTTVDFTGYNATAITIELWVKTSEDNADWRMVLAERDQAGVMAFQFTKGTGAYRFGIGIPGGENYSPTIPDTTIEDGTWHHIAATYDGARIKIYLDGSEVGAPGTAETGDINQVNPWPLSIANRNEANFWTGQIDEVRVWDVARTAQEISDDYQKELVGNESGLTLYAKLNNNNTDETGNYTITDIGTPTFTTDIPFVAGDLNGQDNWSGDISFDVQTTTKYEGAKAVEIVGGPGTNAWISRGITGISDGLVYIAMRRNNTDDGNTLVALRDSGTDIMLVRFDATGYYRIRNDTGWVNVATYNADQWYVIAIEFNDSAQNDKYRTKIHNGSSWSSWSNWENTLNSYSNIDQISLRVDSVTTGVTAYWDRISPLGI